MARRGRRSPAICRSAPINVVVQDRKNRNLLVVGNDIGVFASIDGGGVWSPLKANLPTVAVHDLTIHPRENDLVLATYGRALWTGDITPLQELSADVLGKAAYLFDIEPRARYGFSTQGMNYHLFGDKYIEVPNEPEALVVNYYLAADQSGGAKVTVADASGRALRTIDGPAKHGLNHVLVSLGGGGGRGGGAGGGQPIAVGEYTVTLDVGGAKISKPAKVRERIR